MKYLFLFTIGPVKSFIRESRKTQDLYASSALLSHLCKKAISDAEKEFEDFTFKIITPQISEDAKKLSIPNRFLASIETDNDDILNSKAETIRDQLIKDFSTITIDEKEIELPEGSKKQLRQHLDIRWVFYPINNDYKTAFKNINKELAAIKNANPFDQMDELGRKCIVDGKLNVKFYRESKNNEVKIDPKTGLYNKLYQCEESVKVIKTDDDEGELKIWHLKKGEGISAVTLKKRLHDNEPHEFPSTVEVSLLHLFEKFKDNDAFKLYKEKVQGKEPKNRWFKHSDDQLFYKDNIEQLFREEYETIAKAKAKADKCIKKHEDWSKTIETKDFTKYYTEKKIKECEDAHRAWSKDIDTKDFTKYYALIRFDGDTMGDWFSGDFLKPDKDLKEFHIQLSKNLGAFADYIQTEIDKPKGRIVYAGGEDFMAFVNLHYLKETIDIINTKFKELVFDDELKEYVIKNTEITLSMGIAIAHYKEPLQMVLDKAAAMEKKAKNTGRDRFYLQISKHSGTQLNTSFTWDKFPSIFKVKEAIVSNELSSAFIPKLYEFCEKLGFSNTIGTAIIKSKIKLHVTRAKTNKKDTEIKEVKYLENLCTLSKIIDSKKQEVLDIKNFSEALLAIDFLQRKHYEK